LLVLFQPSSRVVVEMETIKKSKLSLKEKQEQLQTLMSWVTRQIQVGYVPKFSEVNDYANRVLKFNQLKRPSM